MPPQLDSTKYRLLRRLAGGGMGEVYLAAVRGPAGFVKLAVIKRILPQFAADPEFVGMFVNEARVAALLDHPNIVRVYDFGEAEHSSFLVMEYLHGDSLQSVLLHAVRSPARMPLQHALTIGLGICAGLHFAHEKRGPEGNPLGIVHRDVSPANVFITYDGEIKILDFGIAKVLSASTVTRKGSRKGKVPYMSPEQCVDAPLDRRSDIFAIGILLYESTTLTRLFRTENDFATMNMITSGQVPAPSSRVPGYPPALEAVVLKALCVDPEQRYATARELHDDLERVAAELDLRTSTVALGQFVRELGGDRPYPSPDDEHPSETPTLRFFAALNEVVTAHDVQAEAPAVPVAPTAEPVVARRRILPVAVALGAAAVAAATGLYVAARAASPATRDTPSVAPVTTPQPAAPPPVAPVTDPPAVAPKPAELPPSTPPPTGEPAPARGTRRTNSSRKTINPAEKTNVLDSLRPSK